VLLIFHPSFSSSLSLPKLIPSLSASNYPEISVKTLINNVFHGIIFQIRAERERERDEMKEFITQREMDG
jgi:hypothetical protein